MESFLTLEVRPCSGESDESIVAGAWDFARIGRLHEECLRVLRNPPCRKAAESPNIAKLQHWASQERAAWHAVIVADPFLPAKLLPDGYLGRKVWQLRNTVLREAGQWLS